MEGEHVCPCGPPVFEALVHMLPAACGHLPSTALSLTLHVEYAHKNTSAIYCKLHGTAAPSCFTLWGLFMISIPVVLTALKQI